MRARIVEQAEDHRWSSHGANAFGESDVLVSQHGCYRALGRAQALRHAAYRSMFQDDISEETINILRDPTQRGWVPGRDTFREQIEAALGRRVTPQVRGRPRKAQADVPAAPTAQARLL